MSQEDVINNVTHLSVFTAELIKSQVYHVLRKMAGLPTAKMSALTGYTISACEKLERGGCVNAINVEEAYRVAMNLDSKWIFKFSYKSLICYNNLLMDIRYGDMIHALAEENLTKRHKYRNKDFSRWQLFLARLSVWIVVCKAIKMDINQIINPQALNQYQRYFGHYFKDSDIFYKNLEQIEKRHPIIKRVRMDRACEPLQKTYKQYMEAYETLLTRINKELN